MENGENINKKEELEINLKMEEFEYSPEAKALRGRMYSLYEKDVGSAMDKIAVFARELQTRYSLQELHNYEAYCIMAGSSPMKKPGKYDLEGDDSIEKFINSLEE